MLDSPINVRFTDDSYLTRLEVAKALGTNLIDPIWADILRYRASMKHIINVLDISRQPFFVTDTKKNEAKNTAISALFSKFDDEFDAILGGKASKDAIRKEKIEESLNYMRRISVNDNSLYKNAIIEACVNPREEINEDFLAKYLQIVSGEVELTSFYRETDIETESSKYLISREYEAAPSTEIEFLMNGLFDLLKDSSETITNKLVTTIYMFNFVKPFEKYNEEMCGIILKKILAKNLKNHEANFFPVEALLLNKELIKNICKEIQRSRDLTYLFIPLANILEDLVTKTMDKIVLDNTHNLRQAYVAGDDEKKFEEEFGFKPEENVLGPKMEQQIPVEEPKVEEKPVEVVKEQSKQVIVEKKIEVKQENSEEISDKEYKKMANALLESDPYLKKAQAHFYVRHSTVGKFYTIQQFKKAEGCVYETARTSMDNLVNLGYYRREQIKNKFVYTPIKK